MALNTHNQLTMNNNMAAKSVEKLSSGYRINSAADDAAGLAISEKMTAQIRGLDQASRNAQDGISLVQTAEGALSETEAILQRMRELSIQAANDTNTSDDRDAMQLEIDQLSQEIDRIAETTEFNTKKLLNGNAASTATIGTTNDANIDSAQMQGAELEGGEYTLEVSSNSTGQITSVSDGDGSTDTTGLEAANAVALTDPAVSSYGLYEIQVEDGTNSGKKVTLTAPDGTVTSLDDQDATADITIGDFTIAANSITGNGTVEVMVETTELEVTDVVDAGTGLDGETDIVVSDPSTASYGSYQLKVEEDSDNAGMSTLTLIDATTGEEVASQNNVATGTDGAGTTTELAGITIDNEQITGTGTVEFEVEGDHTFTLTDSDGNVVATETVTDHNQSEVEIAGMELEYNTDIQDGTTDIVVTNDSLTMQIGANAGQTMDVAINDMSADALDVDDLDLTTAEGAEQAIESLDNAIKSVSNERAKLGAYQNRLEHTINNLSTSSENLEAAKSRIKDVDMAKEMMEFTKYNVLQQSAQSMLSQANQQPEQVLQLLR